MGVSELLQKQPVYYNTTNATIFLSTNIIVIIIIYCIKQKLSRPSDGVKHAHMYSLLCL